MTIKLTKIQQVKVPVTDLPRSVDWYRSLLDLTLYREFVEHGVLAGAVLADLDSGFLIGLRTRDAIPGHPSLAGFDSFSLGVASVADLKEITRRCDRLGIAHGETLDRGPDGVQLDVPDPDGTVIRFLSPLDFAALPFGGVEFGGTGHVSVYHTPRLAQH